MNVVGVIGALFLAVLLSVIFSRSFRHRGPFGGLLIFGMVVFLAAWAGQIWLQPVGPVAYGVAWVPFTFVGFLIAMLLVASAASTGKINREKSETGPPADNAPLFALGIFFWLLLLFFLVVIFLGYYIAPGTRIMAI